jgi:hypothetical protein
MKKYLALIICVVFTSCELIVNIDVPLEKPQITLNSLFNPDSVWNVQLNLNRHVLDKKPYASVDDAEVTVYENGIFVDKLDFIKNGLYRSQTSKPLSGKAYEIKAKSAQYGEVSGKSSAPQAVQNLSVEFQNSQRDPYNSNSNNYVIDLTFTDAPGERNYYKITAEGDRYFFTSNKKIGKSTLQLRLKLRGQSEEDDYGQAELLFSDLLFDGKKHSLSIEASSYTNISQVRLYLWSLSEDYYHYKETLELQLETSGNPFAQPVNVVNNINGGFGIFGGYSRTSAATEIPSIKITNIDPAHGKPGDHIIISFDQVLPDPNVFETPWTVLFNGTNSFTYGTIYKTNDSSLQVIVPANALTGKIVVFINGIPMFSDINFEVTN